jgi:hypothetical protein
MLTTPDMPIDYLKIPTHHRLVHSTTRRTSLFVEQPNQLDQCISSNLSLPSATNSILKKPNSSGQRQSISSHPNVHYTFIEKDHVDNLEFSPSFIVPTIESSPMIENNLLDPSHENRQRLLKTPTSHGVHALPKKSTWSNPFFRGRYEKRLYSLFPLFFSIKSRIVSMKYKLDISFERLTKTRHALSGSSHV